MFRFCRTPSAPMLMVDCVWNAMAHAQKPDFVSRRNGRVHLNRQGRQFSRLLAAEVCASAVVMLDTPCSELVWRVLATHSIRQFPLRFPSLRHRVPSHFNWTLMLDTPCSGVVWRVLATHSIHQFPLHFHSRASPCAITFQLDYNAGYTMFRGSVKSTGYPLHSPVSPSLPLPCVTVCHHISNWLYYFLIAL